MESLSNFLQFSSVFDWLVMFLAAALVAVGLALLLFVRNRKVLFAFLIVALLPLVLGLLSTWLKYQQLGRVMAMVENSALEVAEAARREAWIITYIGAAGTALCMLVGILALLVKKERNA